MTEKIAYLPRINHDRHRGLGRVLAIIITLSIAIGVISSLGYLQLFLRVLAHGVSLIFLLWGLYNIPILLAGLRKPRFPPAQLVEPPMVSIIIPARNEPWVITRALDISLNHIDYPREKKEIIVVTEDEATSTAARSLALANPDCVKVLLRSAPSRILTKPAAMNDAVHFVKGDIVVVFDAEDMPERDVFRKALPLFNDPNVGAVQGVLTVINSEMKWVSKAMSLEYEAWFSVQMRGRQNLGLFTPLGGTCCFIRRSILKECGWWDARNLTEDLELAVRLEFSGYKIRIINVRAWEEAPVTVEKWLKQRTRWMRGYIQTLTHYGLIAVRNWRQLGVKMTFSLLLGMAAPLVMLIVPLGYTLTFLWMVTDVFKVWMPGLMASSFPWWAIIPLSLNFVFIGFAVAAVLLEGKRLRDLFWVFILFYPYQFLHTFAVINAFIHHITKPVAWSKTEHYGYGVKGFQPPLKSKI